MAKKKKGSKDKEEKDDEPKEDEEPDEDEADDEEEDLSGEEENDEDEDIEDEEEEIEEKKPKKSKKKKKKKLPKEQTMFMGGAALSVISGTMVVAGLLFLIRVSPMRFFFLTDLIDGIPFFYYFCCGLTLLFSALGMGGLVLILKSFQPPSISDKKK